MDNEVGAAGSTGRGEANLYGLCSFLIVEHMRRGMSPKDAGMEALQAHQGQHRSRSGCSTPKGDPRFQLNFYVLNAKGEYAGVSMYASKYAVCTENGPQTLAYRAADSRQAGTTVDEPALERDRDRPALTGPHGPSVFPQQAP